jgi:predicted O-linked N-acetylglucosamine transferase (SPINDLY family)
MHDISQALGAALAHHQAGQLAEAKALYEQILGVEPGHPDALHFLGLLACQVNQHEAGVRLMRQSIAASPNAIYYNNLGNVLKERGELDEAIEGYRHAVALNPGYAEAHNNLGNALREARQPAASMQSCAQAISLRPGYAEAYNNLGNALRDMGETDSAMLAYGKAVAFRPDYADAYHNLGVLQVGQGKLEDAAQSLGAAIALDCDRAVTHRNLGAVRIARGELEAALDSLRRAIALDPADVIAYRMLGDALNRLGRRDEAAAPLSRVIELAPTEAAGYRGLGDAYNLAGKFDAAILCYQGAVDLEPDDADVQHKLSIALLKQGREEEAMAAAQASVSLNPGSAPMHIHLGDVFSTRGDTAGAIACYRHALSLNDEMELAHDRLIFDLVSHAGSTPESAVAAARHYGERMAARARPWQHAAPRGRVEAEAGTRALRIGFVSGDLKLHPVGIFLESVLMHLDRERLELFAYVTDKAEDHITARLKPYFAQWRSLCDVPDQPAAQMIHDDRIDILVDLSGHTVHNRLPVFAWKPAPVQVSWLGFFGTTGLAAMDYVLGDPHVLRAGEEAHFVEKLWRLPDSYLCFTPPEQNVQVGPLPSLANGHMTFGYFGKLTKVTDHVICVWSRLLDAVPGSRLLLKAHQLGADDARRMTASRFAAHGIDATRLVLEGGSPRDEYLAAYNKVDIMLSPFPYPGGTTTAEGLWMGAPVLAMQGDRFVTHICESLLHAAGLAEWIARDEADYIAKAAAFAGDPQRLATLRAGLREQVLNSPLCDARRFARNLEAVFQGMWARYLEDADGAGRHRGQ